MRNGSFNNFKLGLFIDWLVKEVVRVELCSSECSLNMSPQPTKDIDSKLFVKIASVILVT